MRWILALFMAASALVAADDRGPVNSELPKWVTLGFHTRFRAEGQRGIRYVEGSDSDFLLHRYRASVTLKPLPWVQFFGELQDARVEGIPSPDGSVKDSLDVRQAFVTLGSERNWWDLKVGRQKFSYGTERMIGGAEWGNTARVFDAVRLGLHRGLDRVDVLASSVVVNDADQWDRHQQGNNLHGVYASIGSLVKGSKVEPYVLMRTSPRAANDAGQFGRYRGYTTGLRSAGALGKLWSYEADAQLQRGRVAVSRLRAWAAMLNVQRSFPNVRWQPTLLGEYSFASGDRVRGDGEVNTLDQLYPTNHYFYGIADLVARRNAKATRAAVILKPRGWLTMRFEGNGLWLASKYDALYSANGAVSVPAVPGGASATRIGEEIDAIGILKLSKYYDLGAQVGYMAPGPFLKAHTPGASRVFYAVYADFRL